MDYLNSNELPPIDKSKFQSARYAKSFYMPRMVLDRSMYPKGAKIPVVSFVDHDILKEDKDIQQHDFSNSLKYHRYPNPNQPPIDQWVPKAEDRIFDHIRGAIIVPVHKFFNMPDDCKANNMFDYFYVTAKRCYNSDTKIKDGQISIGFRDHCTNYINYFEKFYDTDHHLVALYAKIKFLIDTQTKDRKYTYGAFKHDLWKYFINPNGSYEAQILNYHLDRMNMEQYNLELNYTNNKSPVLEYSDYHARIMLKLSVMQNMIIPLLTHFIEKNKMDQQNIKDILLDCFDLLFENIIRCYHVDLGAKFYETTSSNVIKNITNNMILWEMQTIRARNSTTHSMETVDNIIMQIIPKYTFSKNIIHFNYNAINRDIKFRVTEVPYEYGFVMLSSSIRDDDNNSECDKFEAHAAKLNEAIMIQTKVNCSSTMERIEIKYGPFDEQEILFYYHELCKDGQFVVNSLQSALIFFIFAKEFGEMQPTRIVNIRQYIILIIAAKRKLQSERMNKLPYMVGGRVNRVVSKKNINKRELEKIESSVYYQFIKTKYKEEKIIKDILTLIAQVLSSEFQYIEYHMPDRIHNGETISILPDVVSEEIIRLVLEI